MSFSNNVVRYFFMNDSMFLITFRCRGWIRGCHGSCLFCVWICMYVYILPQEWWILHKEWGSWVWTQKVWQWLCELRGQKRRRIILLTDTFHDQMCARMFVTEDLTQCIIINGFKRVLYLVNTIAFL